MQSDKFKNIAGKLEEFFAENRFVDDFTKIAGSAVGAAAGAKKDLENRLKNIFESFLVKMDFVPREEHEVLHDLVKKLAVENEEIKKRIVELEKNKN